MTPTCPCDPVGAVEIADRLGVARRTVDQWRQRNLDFPAPRWTVGGRPAWRWEDIEAWAHANQHHLIAPRERSTRDVAAEVKQAATAYNHAEQEGQPREQAVMDLLGCTRHIAKARIRSARSQGLLAVNRPPGRPQSSSHR